MIRNKSFVRDYVLYIGSTFDVEVLLDDIYVSLNPVASYSVSVGAKLSSDDSQFIQMYGELIEDNSKLRISLNSVDSSNIPIDGEYNYAVDISLDGVINTILEGTIITKKDVSNN